MCFSATDAKERQHWVSRLQICTQHHTEAMGKVTRSFFIMFQTDPDHSRDSCTERM